MLNKRLLNERMTQYRVYHNVFMGQHLLGSGKKNDSVVSRLILALPAGVYDYLKCSK